MKGEGKKNSNGELFRISSSYGQVAPDWSHNPHGSVALDWTHNPPGEMAAWASCFHYAAQTLVRDLSTRSAYADRESCPIVFLYRHALELCLKALLLEYGTLAQVESEEPLIAPELMTRHRLEPLLRPLEKMFALFSGRWALGVNTPCSYDELLCLVRELDSLDGGSFSFRYPVDKTFRSPSLPPHLHFDVFALSRRMDAVLTALQELMAAVGSEISRVLDEEDEALMGDCNE